MGRLRIAHLQLMVPFVVIAWRAGLAFGDNSFLWHVRAGSVQLDTTSVLTTDPFSFTALGEPWRTQSWLAELGYAWLEDMTGWIEWVPIMKFVVISITVSLVGIAIHRAGGRRPGVTLAGLLLLVWQAVVFAVSRPSLLGFTLLAMVIAIAHTNRRPLWVLPPLFWLWASVHGMFVVGLGYLFLDAMRRRSRRQVIAVAVSGLATGLTAHGLAAWGILIDFFENQDALDLMEEWKPPDFSNPFVLPLLLIIIGVIVAATLGRVEPRDLWIVIPFVTFGLLAGRNIWPAAMVLAPIAARVFDRDAQEGRAPPQTEAFVLNWGIAAVLVAAAAIGVIRPVELREDRFPSRAAVAALQPGPQFNGTAVGGYLIYQSYPERPVFIDDRAELYGYEGISQFHDVRSGVGVEEVFAEYGIRQAIMSADWPLIEYLELLGWEYRYEDEFFTVMAQTP